MADAVAVIVSPAATPVTFMAPKIELEVVVIGMLPELAVDEPHEPAVLYGVNVAPVLAHVKVAGALVEPTKSNRPVMVDVTPEGTVTSKLVAPPTLVLMVPGMGVPLPLPADIGAITIEDESVMVTAEVSVVDWPTSRIRTSSDVPATALAAVAVITGAADEVPEVTGLSKTTPPESLPCDVVGSLRSTVVPKVTPVALMDSEVKLPALMSVGVVDATKHRSPVVIPGSDAAVTLQPVPEVVSAPPAAATFQRPVEFLYAKPCAQADELDVMDTAGIVDHEASLIR